MSHWQTILAIDFDKHAAATYAANFPSLRVVCGSVADEVAALPYADVIVGGPPCQPFSDAGENEGEDDERDCIPDFAAAIERGQPRQFLMENVRGLLKQKHLPYFGRMLARFEAAGYMVEYRLSDAVDFGVPQFRARVWVWGIRKDVWAAGARHQWPKETHQWPPAVPGMFGHIGRLAGVTVGRALGIPVIGSCRDTRVALGEKEKFSEGPNERIGAPHFTLDGKQYGGVLEYDHGVAVLCEPSPTLKAGGNVDVSGKQGGGCPPVIEYRWSDEMLKKHPPASPASPASPAPTVQAKYYKGGAEGLVLEMVDNPKHQPHQLHQPANTLSSGGSGHGMSAANYMVEIDTKQHRTRQPITAPAPAPAIATDSRHHLRRQGLFVRRLTPLECLRLQSGPDDFKWPSKITKTAMYRIVGNGWACAMGAFFADAFHAADPVSRTVIDLFCGGGLGASGWHGRFWKLT